MTKTVNVGMQGQWDLETQEFHGGQSWRQCPNFRADFSVTTNTFGPPKSASDAARAALDHIQHYPPADAAEATKALARFCDWPKSRMLLGNGASEFIDLMMKVLPSGPFRPPPYIATYQEYHRAARAAGRTILQPSASDVGCDDHANYFSKENPVAVSVYIRPNSPTGECITLSKLEEVLWASPSMSVIVDESFLPFSGPSWRDISALNLIDRFPRRLVVIQSWTKLWSCPGIRLGSVCASGELIKEIKRLQTPWSCNSLAQAFTIAAVDDTDYLKRTWQKIPEWRKLTMSYIDRLGWEVYEKSSDWVPWLFIRCPSENDAAIACKAALSVGCPVRHCASYGLPRFIRIAVRQPEHQECLFDSLLAQLNIITDQKTRCKSLPIRT